MLILSSVVKKARATLWLSLFAFGLVLLSGCQTKELVIDGYVMGTSYQIKVRELPADIKEDDLRRDLSVELNRLNRVFSTYIRSSELSQFNRLPVGVAAELSPELCEVFVLSRRIFELTEGSFDPTVGPLVDLWGFGPEKDRPRPEPGQVKQALAKIGFDRIQLKQCSAMKLADVQVDFSAIAKGYAVDLASAMLKRKGLTYHLVEIGGEIKASNGTDSSDKARKSWLIGIERPRDAKERSAVAALELYDHAVATSGDYRNYHVLDGARFSHTIDPKTGYPVTHHLASVTVVTNDCASADALATGFNVMGPERSMAVAEQEGIALYLIVYQESGFSFRYSSAFKTYLSE
jgi:thiamine biosynthesis lipoprotein